MTRRDTLACVHEPFGDAFYFGPERLSERYENDVDEREASGFQNSTFRTVFERLERDQIENEVGYLPLARFAMSFTLFFLAVFRCIAN